MLVHIHRNQKPTIVQKKNTMIAPLPKASGIVQRVPVQITRVVIEAETRTEEVLKLDTSQPEAFMALVTAEAPNPIVTISKIIFALKAIPKDEKNVPELLKACIAYQEVLLKKVSLPEIVVSESARELIEGPNATDSTLIKNYLDIAKKAKEIQERLEDVTRNDQMIERMEDITMIGEEVFRMAMKIGFQLMGGPLEPMALYSAGGFGRRELAPGSDLDVGIMGSVTDRGRIIQYSLTLISVLRVLQGEINQTHPLRRGAKPLFDMDFGWINGGNRGAITPESVVKMNISKQGGEIRDIRMIPMGLEGEDGVEADFINQKKLHIQSLKLHMIPSKIADQLQLQKLVFMIEGGTYDIKTPYLRYITLCIQRLSICFPIKGDSTIERISELMQLSLMPIPIGKNLINAFLLFTRIRHELHQVYHGEGDYFRVQKQGFFFDEKVKEKVQGNFHYIIGLGEDSVADEKDPYPDGLALLSYKKLDEVNEAIMSRSEE
ncbi:MAG: hypothetical protein LBM69_01365, partial [Lachnospiraceae bacterium]|nr:hypothetical protein [Lachnospiraceae bacterium]